MEDMDLVVDLTTEDLQRLLTLPPAHAERQRLTPKQIRLGGYYTNGKLGTEWSVRHIIDEHRSSYPEHDMVIYHVVGGRGLRSSGNCTQGECARWAQREIFPNAPRH